MNYEIKQYRYYSDTEKTSNITQEQLTSGSVFPGNIVSLGIQCNITDDANKVPFYINGSTDPILPHPYGLYEIDLTGHGRITSLHFDEEKLGAAVGISDFQLIIDMVCEEGGS